MSNTKTLQYEQLYNQYDKVVKQNKSLQSELRYKERVCKALQAILFELADRYGIDRRIVNMKLKFKM